MADAVVNFLVENLLQLLAENVKLIGSAKGELENLLKISQQLKGFLDDAAKYGHTNSEQWKVLVEQIHKTVYRAEDAIDKFLVQAKLHQDKNIAERTFDWLGNQIKVKNFAADIKEIHDQIKEIRNNNQALQATPVLELPKKGEVIQGPSLENDAVVGFDDEANKVIKRLVEGPLDSVDIIPVVGMPGLGKTTLARKIYNDPNLTYEFYSIVWVYVGKEYKAKDIYLEILKFFKKNTDDHLNDDVDTLAKAIGGYIKKGGRCLIVLDDVWEDDVIDHVMKVFAENKKGHRIMMTTRDTRLGYFANKEPHMLKFLETEESFELLVMRVFGRGRCPNELVVTGKQIARKCGGVPLVVVVIAGALRGRSDKKDWERVEKSVVQYLGEHTEDSCLKYVKMSYDYLPREVQMCFLYCGVFPRGFDIPCWKLIRLWIAEGLIKPQPESTLQVEEIAEFYLTDLLNRNLVIMMQKRSDGQIKTCRLHDMLYQFCKKEASNKWLFQEHDQSKLDPDTCRRLCIQPSNLSDFLSTTPSAEHVRSFYCFSSKQKPINLSPNETKLIHKAFPLMRVMDAESLRFIFSKDFKTLFHLRYIAISGDFKSLPPTFGKFWNLQTLILNTSTLEPTLEVKADIWNLLQLRHLHTNIPAKLPSPTTTTGKPSCLQTLSMVTPESCEKEVLAKACNVKKLSIRGQMAAFLGAYKGGINNLKELQCLEHLKLLNDVLFMNKALHLPSTFSDLVRTVKKLTLTNTRFTWNEAEKLGTLESLEVLKFKENAFTGDSWKPKSGFSALQVLWIERSDFSTSELVSSAERVRAPRYRMIPIETDLNTLPLLSSIPDKVLPLVAIQSRTSADLLWESGTNTSNLARKGEALAVSGLVEYGEEIDVIAPTDILKQIFKIPYSKARLSIAVHRVGKTLVLNTGPDIEEGEKLIRRNNNPPKCADQSLFLNFAMHSVRMEACDCPPTHTPPNEWQCESRESSPESFDHPIQSSTSYEQSGTSTQEDQSNQQCTYNELKQTDCFWGKKNRKNKGQGAGKKVSQVKEKSRYSVHESEKFRRPSNDGFLRVLFWQFHNFRMLLGSDLLIFSNEKYVAVSLHLWDVSRQVTPLTWLEAWLDNVMASVPELAICYHQDGVVQGYELLKTDDIFLLKGISEDGTPAFHPSVVQQNGLSVLRFLEENCKQDPGAYWLYKSAGEDAIQLFDLSVIPQNRPANDTDDSSCSVPSLINRGRSDPLLSLGTILYRIAHRLSLSMSPENKSRCASFFRKCLDFLDAPDHLVVRACAHEQFARLLLTYDEMLDLSSEALPRESEVTSVDAEEELVESLISVSLSDVHDSLVPKVEPDNNIETLPAIGSDDFVRVTSDEAKSSPRAMTAPRGGNTVCLQEASNSREKSCAVCDLSKMSPKVQTVADPISTKLAAIHHVSQAIKSLRWKRQLQSNRMDLQNSAKNQDELPSAPSFSVCACGDTDCIEVCDIREWLPTSKLDDKLWKLVLLLGESYLALGQAYREDGQLNQALKVVELACLVYGSMPQHRQDSKFVSSMFVCSLPEVKSDDKSEKAGSSLSDGCFMYDQSSDSYLFWAKAWTLVGDMYVEFHSTDGDKMPVQSEQKPLTKELKMSSDVLREVERLKKTLGQSSQNCSSCSLLNCSCQSDRASSGSSASSSSRDSRSKSYGRKQKKKSHTKANAHAHSGTFVDIHQKAESSTSESKLLMHKKNIARIEMSNKLKDSSEAKNSGATNSDRDNMAVKMDGTSAYKCSETLKEESERKSGGIFKYLRGTVAGDADNLSNALNCYDEARNAMVGHLANSEDLQSLIRKKGWVCNELGRKRMKRNELDEAEVAFADAINAFKEVADHTNIILINCNLGHGRRALAEEMVAKIENLKEHAILHDAYMQVLQGAKMEYRESLRFYGSAKTVVNHVTEESDVDSSYLRNEVYTQFAHTYLRLGMLLASEDTFAEVYENCVLEDSFNSSVSRPKIDRRKHEISANDAIREALSVYESLGELRKQESAYAYFQLACYQRDCCLKFLEQDQKKHGSSKGEKSFLHRVKQYASLAERNWQKSLDFYGPKTHSFMHLAILVERAGLLLDLSNLLHYNVVLESALTCMFEARHVPVDELGKDNPKICDKYWSQLQKLLKKMLSVSLCATKSSANSQHSASSKSADAAKLRELYKMSLKYTDFSQLQVMHDLWTS